MAKEKIKKSTGKAGTQLLVDAAEIGGAAEFWRHGLGQGGLSDEAWMIGDHISPLKNLKLKYIRLFVQEYYDVYPAHKTYNWKKLDAVVDSIIKTGARPLMCICIKPAVLYPVVDQTVVNPVNYKEWDELIYKMVRHYNFERKDGIVYWEVFNEPNIGESGGCPGLFSPEDYCLYYDHTVKAMLRADSSVKVGGPALAGWKSNIELPWLTYCHKHNLPVDFVSWHFYADDPATPKMGADYFRELLKRFPSLKPEFMIGEWNIGLNWKRKDEEFQVCYIPEAIKNMLEAGVDYSFYYQIRDCHVPEEPFKKIMSKDGARFMINYWNEMPQRFGLFDFQGIIKPAYFMFKLLSKLTGKFIKVDSGSETVKAFAVYNSEMKLFHVLVWNFKENPPPVQKVSFKIKNMEKRTWNYKRYSLEVKIKGNLENDRLLLTNEAEGVISEISDSFTLAPYGITFITLVSTGYAPE